ncbi:MAG TPA: DMT family transporter [Stellaceae bacterium]|jgi:drug/metabolite transporter (DMT)-like permease|nr:DMT family transporter [Stellaceae bacterium]
MTLSEPEAAAADGTGRAAPQPQVPLVAYVYLAIIVLTWASNWPLMKLALGQIPPLKFVLLRLVGSVVLIVPPLVAARQSLLPYRGERLILFWVGELQVAGFLICSIIGLAIVPAGRAIVLAYTMPLWAIPIGIFIWPERHGRAQLIGAAVCFAGLVLFMNPGLVDWGNPRILAGNGLLLLASILWAFGSCLYRRRQFQSPFWVQTFWQLAVSVPPVAAIVALWVHGPVEWSPGLVAIVLYNCLVTTALGYFFWGKVLSMMPAAMAGQVLTLTPICGFVLSLMIFGGTLSGDVLASIALIAAGIFVMLRR